MQTPTRHGRRFASLRGSSTASIACMILLGLLVLAGHQAQPTSAHPGHGGPIDCRLNHACTAPSAPEDVDWLDDPSFIEIFW